MKQQNETGRTEATNAQSYAQLRFNKQQLGFYGRNDVLGDTNLGKIQLYFCIF